MMELYVTGIKLRVPTGAFEDDTVVELSIMEPSFTPNIPIDFLVKQFLSDAIKIGTAESDFNVPAILSIPHSITDIPMHSSICINYFNEGINTWQRLPRSSGI